MSGTGSWVAGSVRARLLVAERRLGVDGARRLADCASFADALVELARSPYRHDTTHVLTLAEAQRVVATKLLVDLRLVAGWLPPDALAVLRPLAGWFELANVEDRAAYLEGAALRAPFELGSLAVCWPRASAAQTVAELRAALAASAWGDPGGESAADVGLGLRLAWARRVADIPEATAWASGAAALVLAREVYVRGVAVELRPVSVPLLGNHWQGAPTFQEFAAALPATARWALGEIDGPHDLWRAELRWWAHLEEDARRVLHTGVAGRAVVVAAAALLAVDAHRTSTALAAVARRGLRGVEEAYDAAA